MITTSLFLHYFDGAELDLLLSAVAARCDRFPLNSRQAVPVVAYTGMCPSAGMLATHGLNGSLNKPCEHHELEDCLVPWCRTYWNTPALRETEHSQGHAVWHLAGRQTEARPASTG